MPDASAPKRWTDENGTLHERYRAEVFVGLDHLGSFEFDPGDHAELHYRRTGVAYFCPCCGDVWARLVLLDSEGNQSCLDAHSVSCHNHPDLWEEPGSLLCRGLEGLVDLLPPAALRRELEIYLKRLEKKNVLSNSK